MHALTNSEVMALDAILAEAIKKSKEEDDGDPIFHEVNVKDVNPFFDGAMQSRVYDDLARKGLVECSRMEDMGGNLLDEYVCITPEGVEALKTAQGVH